MTTKTDELAALHPSTIANILRLHEAFVAPTVHNLPPVVRDYDPRGGTYLGAFWESEAPADRSIVVLDDWMPSEDDLAGVRLDASTGDVVINVVRPAPEPEPEPEFVDEFVDDGPGRALDDHTARRIVQRHRTICVPWLANPRPAGLPPTSGDDLPEVTYAYRSDGVLLGAPSFDEELAKHTDRCVLLSDHELPSVEALTASVRVHSDGRVTQVAS